MPPPSQPESYVCTLGTSVIQGAFSTVALPIPQGGLTGVSRRSMPFFRQAIRGAGCLEDYGVRSTEYTIYAYGVVYGVVFTEYSVRITYTRHDERGWAGECRNEPPWSWGVMRLSRLFLAGPSTYKLAILVWECSIVRAPEVIVDAVDANAGKEMQGCLTIAHHHG